MGNRVIYSDLKNFDTYKRTLINGKESFTVVKTVYTKKVVMPYRTIIFNDGGIDDFSVLSLINKVRSDAKKFKGDLYQNINDKIDYYRLFFDPVDFLCVKIDLSAAYWTAALQKGIITEKTDKFFIELYKNKLQSSAKSARLKALGSLATTKITEIYEKGIFLHDEILPETQPTKKMYLWINKTVDDLMKSAAMEFDTVVYYYWDCVFIANNQSKDFLQYIDDRGYKAKKTGETLLSIQKVGNMKYLKTIADGKCYMIRPEDEYLINSKINKIQYEQKSDRHIW